MANFDQNLLLDDEALERHRVRRVPLGDHLVFLFEADAAPVSGCLACTMLVEGSADGGLENRWMDLSRHIYVRTPTNLIIRANSISASAQNGVNSPIQKLVFDTEGQVPVSIGCDDPSLMLEVYFPFEVLRALSDDLGGGGPLTDIAF